MNTQLKFTRPSLLETYNYHLLEKDFPEGFGDEWHRQPTICCEFVQRRLQETPREIIIEFGPNRFGGSIPLVVVGHHLGRGFTWKEDGCILSLFEGFYESMGPLLEFYGFREEKRRVYVKVSAVKEES